MASSAQEAILSHRAVRTGIDEFSRAMSTAYLDKTPPYGATLASMWAAAHNGDDEDGQYSLTLKSGVLMGALRLYKSSHPDESQRVPLSQEAEEQLKSEIISACRQVCLWEKAWEADDDDFLPDQVDFAPIRKNLEGIVGPSEDQTESQSADGTEKSAQ